MRPQMMVRDAAGSLMVVILLGACAGDVTSIPATDFVGGHPVLAVTGVATRDAQIAVGDSIFNDKALSRFNNQSCASCHSAAWGFSPPDDGSIETIDAAFMAGSFNSITSRGTPRFGKRKSPPAAYAAFAPTLKFNTQEGTWVGGNFWDGRATGFASNSPAVDQALGPFLSAGEHAFSEVCVLWEISRSSYATLFQSGSPVRFSALPFSKIGTAATINAMCHSPSQADIPRLPSGWTDNDLTTAMAAYQYVGTVIAEFEKSPKVSRFNAKWDDVLAGAATFTADEAAGRVLFEGKGTCKVCHSSDVGREQFTDFSYYNLGVPKHPKNSPRFVDVGLGKTINDPLFNGFFKSPSLRNVAKLGIVGARKTYMHNGALTSLEQVVHFYNTRDVKPCAPGVTGPLPKGPNDRTRGACWPVPEFPNTLVADIGNIGLTPEEERVIVAYMRTFTDR